MAVYVSIGEATGSLPLVKGCVWKSRGVCGTLSIWTAYVSVEQSTVVYRKSMAV